MDAPKYKNKCCVPGCNDKATKRHRFPNPKKDLEMMQKWIENIGAPKLRELEPARIYLTCFVCERHFAETYVVPGKRGLTRDAVPTLCLSVISEEVEGVVLESAKHGDRDGDTVVPESEIVQQNPNENNASTSEYSPGVVHLAAHNGDCSETDPSGAIGLCPPRIGEVDAGHASKKGITEGSVRKRKGILQEVNVTRQKDLTPRCKKFYAATVNWCRKTAKLNYKVRSLQKRLFNAEKVSNCPNFANLLEYVSPTTYVFIMQQIRNQHVTPRARRFTMEEKLLCLTLLKASTKGYRLLSKLFCLPSMKTLTNLLNKITLRPGLNQQILDHLKRSVDNLKNLNDRKCALIFDEMTISSHLYYNQKEDCIDGLEDFGDAQTNRIANHANVFFIKGVNRQWKQPLSFSFSHGPTKSVQLKKMIRSVVRACQKIRLEVVCTICDQGSANRAAINALLKDTAEIYKRAQSENPYFGFVIGGKEVVPLYDVPHLFKGIRNNLLKHPLYFEQDGCKKLAKWAHIEKLYLLDSNDDTRLCPSLTDAHVYPAKMNKMKVSLMAQVFSYRVGALMKRTSQWDIQHEDRLPAEADQTADLILFLDKLFDSLNGNSLRAPTSKPLKGGVTTNSGHIVFWYEAIRIIDTMRFWWHQKNKYVQVPSTVNLVKTLKGFIYLSRKLLDSMRYILPRAFNQDCVENFFAAIRTHGRRNTSPDVVNFITSFKALLVTNFMSSHSPEANCEEDFHSGALDTLREFITGEACAGVQPLEPSIDAIESISIPNVKRSSVARATIAYFAGFVGRRMMVKNKQCSRCRQLLTHSDGNVPMDVIEAREYPGAKLERPGSYLYFLCCHVLALLFYLIPRHCKLRKLAAVLNNTVNKHLNFAVLNCEEHPSLGASTCQLIIRSILFFWCKRVNKILTGKDQKFVHMLKHQTCGIDPIKTEAHKMYLSSRKCKK